MFVDKSATGATFSGKSSLASDFDGGEAASSPWCRPDAWCDPRAWCGSYDNLLVDETATTSTMSMATSTSTNFVDKND